MLESFNKMPKCYAGTSILLKKSEIDTMRFVVTGGSGFLGSHLVDMLLSDGQEVVIIDKISNYESLHEIKESSLLSRYFLDLANFELVRKVIRRRRGSALGSSITCRCLIQRPSGNGQTKCLRCPQCY